MRLHRLAGMKREKNKKDESMIFKYDGKFYAVTNEVGEVKGQFIVIQLKEMPDGTKLPECMKIASNFKNKVKNKNQVKKMILEGRFEEFDDVSEEKPDYIK